MNEIDEERVMTRFLLGALDPAERERVVDRLAEEPSYFEDMAATEDDLILRWHHCQLSTEDRALFDEAYLRSPARRARVDETLALVEAAKVWKEREAAGLWTSIVRLVAAIRRWLTAPFPVPGFAFGALLVATFSLTAYEVRNATRQPGSGGPQPIQSTQLRVLPFPLTAVGERGPGTVPTMAPVTIPPGTEGLLLSVEIPSPKSGERFEAELIAVDGGAVAQPSPPLIVPSVIGATAVVVVASPPDGDYVLRWRRVAGGSSEVVATRAFRVTRG